MRVCTGQLYNPIWSEIPTARTHVVTWWSTSWRRPKSSLWPFLIIKKWQYSVGLQEERTFNVVIYLFRLVLSTMWSIHMYQKQEHLKTCISWKWVARYFQLKGGKYLPSLTNAVANFWLHLCWGWLATTMVWEGVTFALYILYLYFFIFVSNS